MSYVHVPLLHLNMSMSHMIVAAFEKSHHTVRMPKNTESLQDRRDKDTLTEEVFHVRSY